MLNAFGGQGGHPHPAFNPGNFGQSNPGISRMPFAIHELLGLGQGSYMRAGDGNCRGTPQNMGPQHGTGLMTPTGPPIPNQGPNSDAMVPYSQESGRPTATYHSATGFPGQMVPSHQGFSFDPTAAAGHQFLAAAVGGFDMQMAAAAAFSRNQATVTSMTSDFMNGWFL